MEKETKMAAAENAQKNNNPSVPIRVEGLDELIAVMGRIATALETISEGKAQQLQRKEAYVDSEDDEGYVYCSPDNQKFSEQYNRILRAVRTVQTTYDRGYIDTLQRVMDDACARARQYATEKQLNLIECRVADFNKYAYDDEVTAPEWVRELPTASETDNPTASFQLFLQAVEQGLSDTTNVEQRKRVVEMCLVKAKKQFTTPIAEYKQRESDSVETIIENLFREHTEKYINDTDTQANE